MDMEITWECITELNQWQASINKIIRNGPVPSTHNTHTTSLPTHSHHHTHIQFPLHIHTTNTHSYRHTHPRAHMRARTHVHTHTNFPTYTLTPPYMHPSPYILPLLFSTHSSYVSQYNKHKYIAIQPDPVLNLDLQTLNKYQMLLLLCFTNWVRDHKSILIHTVQLKPTLTGHNKHKNNIFHL